MVEIKKSTDGRSILNGRYYWAVSECHNLEDGSVNPNYFFVIKRDDETIWDYKENIYSVKDNKFLFEVWYDSVGHGIIHDGKYFVVEYKWYNEYGRISKRLLNKASITEGKLMQGWKDSKEFYKI